jgi:hypothetical protein
MLRSAKETCHIVFESSSDHGHRSLVQGLPGARQLLRREPPVRELGTRLVQRLLRVCKRLSRGHVIRGRHGCRRARSTSTVLSLAAAGCRSRHCGLGSAPTPTDTALLDARTDRSSYWLALSLLFTPAHFSLTFFFRAGRFGAGSPLTLFHLMAATIPARLSLFCQPWCLLVLWALLSSCLVHDVMGQTVMNGQIYTAGLAILDTPQMGR